MQLNQDREREQVHQIPGVIPINTEYHATPNPLLPVVSDYNPDDYSIGASQLSEG